MHRESLEALIRSALAADWPVSPVERLDRAVSRVADAVTSRDGVRDALYCLHEKGSPGAPLGGGVQADGAEETPSPRAPKAIYPK